MEHGHEVAVPHDADPWNLLGSRRVRADQLQAVGRGPQEAGVEGAGEAQVAGVLGGAGGLGEGVLAGEAAPDHLELGEGLGLDLAQVARQLPALHQLAEGGAALGGRLHPDGAVLQGQVRDRGTQGLGRHAQEHSPRFRSGAPEDGGRHPHGEGAARGQVPGAEVRVPQEHVHLGRIQLQLFGDEHGQHRRGALPQLGLPHEAADTAVGGDLQEGIEVFREGPGPGGLDRRCAGGGREKEGERARRCGLEEGPPFHRTPPVVLPTASTASRIRTWAPQRQMFPSMASTICSRVALGFFFRKAQAAMIIPEVQ